MVTRAQIDEVFKKDGTYLLLVDLFRHIVDVRSGFRTNDKGSEKFCQFVKYASFTQKKISDPWFFGDPVYETEIIGSLGETELSISRRGKGTGVWTNAPFDFLEVKFDSEKVCTFEVGNYGGIDLQAYKRGKWLSVLRGEHSEIEKQKQPQSFEVLRKLDEKLDEDDFRL